MSGNGSELTKLTDEYRRTKAVEAYDRIEAMANSNLLRSEDPRTYLAANVWLMERGLGKTPDKLDVNIEMQPWAVVLRQSIRGTRSNGNAPIPTASMELPGPSDDGDDDVILWGAG